MTLHVVVIDNVLGECKAGVLTNEYIGGLDEEEIPVARLLKVLSSVKMLKQ